MQVHLIAQSHIDPVFMWGWDEGLATVLNTCAEAVRKLRRHPELRFTFSSAMVHDWIRRCRPALWHEIVGLAAEGRWVPAGGWYVEGDTCLPAGESLVRQALVGQAMFDALLGQRSDCAYLLDSFGHPRTLPKVLVHCGFRSFAFSRPGEKLQALPAPLFRWEGDDGSSVLCYRIPIGYSTYTNEVERIGECIERNDGDVDAAMCFFGLGDHGGGPTEQQLARVQEFGATPDAPALRFSDPTAFFASFNGDEHPSFRGGLEPFAVGCYSAAAGLKREHDEAQAELLAAERAVALVTLFAAPGPVEATAAARDATANDAPCAVLARAWRDLLFTQFHDLLPGSAIARGLEYAQRLAAGARAAAEETRVVSLTRLAGAVDTAAEGYVRFLVFNTADTARTVYVEYEPWLFWQAWSKYRLIDSTGAEVPHQRIHSEAAAPAIVRLIVKLRLPANGYELLRVVGPEPDLSDFAVTEDGQSDMVNRRVNFLEAPRSRLDFNDAADASAIRTWTHSGTGAPLSGPSLLDAVVLRDRSDTWSLKETGYADVAGRFGTPEATQIEAGPLRWTAQLRRTFGKSAIEQELRLLDESDLLEVHTRIDWREPWHVLKLVVPSPFRTTRVTRGVAFGADAVPAPGVEFAFQDWILLEPADDDSTEGVHSLVILAGPGLHAADVTDNAVRLTLVRSPLHCHEELNRRYDPGARHRHMDIGEHECVLGLLPLFTPTPHAVLREQALCLGGRYHVITTDGHDGPLPARGTLLEVGPANIAVSAVKPAEAGNGTVLRVWETAGTDTCCEVSIAGWRLRFAVPANSIRAIRFEPNASACRAEAVNGLEEPVDTGGIEVERTRS